MRYTKQRLLYSTLLTVDKLSLSTLVEPGVDDILRMASNVMSAVCTADASDAAERQTLPVSLRQFVSSRVIRHVHSAASTPLSAADDAAS